MRQWRYETPFRVPTLADVDFVDLLRGHHVSGNVFVFGSGYHHHVGTVSHVLGLNIKVHAVTTSKEELNSYVDMLDHNPKLMDTYRVGYADAYGIKAGELPELEVAYLPCLWEYSGGDYALDKELMAALCKRLSQRGMIVLSTRSPAYEGNAFRMPEDWHGSELFKSLRVYRRSK